MTTHVDVLVLGAGLAGLSCAYHLQKETSKKIRVLVAEKKSSVGGLAGSVRQEGFTFDYTGHLLHLHTPYGKRLILDLLKGNTLQHQRRSWIYSQKTLTRYPFQANTFGLPTATVRECVTGFLRSLRRAELQKSDKNPSFQDWALATFGEGICRHFMFPYNRKLWRAPLSEMTPEWVAPFVPRSQLEEVLYGALAPQKKFFGYNATFRYPKKGGTQALAGALAERISHIVTNAPATHVDLKRKRVEIEGVGEVAYEILVTTLPLPHFLDLAGALPEGLRLARRGLRYAGVLCLNLGVNRPRISQAHWIYFPEKSFPFYRVGFYSNFSPHAAPPGTSSLYIEFARPGFTDPLTPFGSFPLREMEKTAWQNLSRCGLLKGRDRPVVSRWLPIPCAYVIYDRHRRQALPFIQKFLLKNHVHSIGRYGAWKYSFMEEAILDGKKTAEAILAG
ncbi:MAG: FAD-dependent oxidoreductase [Elusimicrobia bacterium]|nr:FAD-dependent oxidoreductase [Elusimicrobiota bacterium]